MVDLRRTVAWVAGLLVLGLAVSGRAENWARFRGPGGLGHTPEKNLPIRWGGKDKENVLWRADLKGQGHASPIVWGDRVFVCTVFWPASVTDRKKVIPEHHVLCYGAADGRLLWDRTIRPGPWVRTDFRSGPGGGYAAPTPTTDGKLVFVAYGSSVMAALDFAGKVVWRKEIKPRTFDVTLGSSPVLYKDAVILLCAMARKQDSRLVAFRKDTGEVAWQTPLPTVAFGHSTPIVFQAGGRWQVVFVASGISTKPDGLQSFDPANGKRLWWARGSGDASSPAYGGGVVYCDSGRGGPGTAVDPTGTGDVTATHTRWTIRSMPSGISSPLIAGGHLYRLHGSSLGCWDLKTGKRVYSERLKGISSPWASPIADANGRIYFANAGKSYVIQAGEEFKVLAVNDLGDGSHPSPAVAEGRMFLVGKKYVHCLGKK